MKTSGIKIATLSLTVALIAFSYAGYSSENSNLDAAGTAYFEQYFEYEELNDLLDIQLKPELNVKIYNVENKLVATGNENDEKMKSMIPESDLLTEVNGVKYYRLSYK